MRRRKPELIQLCEKPLINTAIYYKNHIYILVGEYIFMFDGKSTEESVFGELVEGPLHVNDKFEGLKVKEVAGFEFDGYLWGITQGPKWFVWNQKNIIYHPILNRVILNNFNKLILKKLLKTSFSIHF